MPQNYVADPDAMRMPWVESPFFNSLVGGIEATEEEKFFALDFNTKGYVVVDSGLPEEKLDAARDAAIQAAQVPTTKTQVGYHYTDSPRLWELWKNIPAIRDIALNPRILSLLKLFYRRDPIPFSTINFLKGSGQPLHSDEIHFGTIPHKYLTAAWYAFEDMDENNGTLCVVPGSHRLPLWHYYDLKIQIPEFSKGNQLSSYHEYEEFIRQYLAANGLSHKAEPVICRKGQVILWAANLIHGGYPIKDPTRTRHSQACHYHYEGMDHYFNPKYSIPAEGKLIERDMSKTDIRKP